MSIDDLISKSNAFGIVLLEPFLRSIGIGKHLQMVPVADFLVGIDIDPNGRHIL